MKTYLVLALLFFLMDASGQGLIINEISNGQSGAREYVELMVIGDTSCEFVDIRGFILDDNNGVNNDGFSSNQIGAGVSAGHIRFDSITRWQNLVPGTLILIYNSVDKNPSITMAEDTNDTNPFDSVFVLADTACGLSGCSTIPKAGGGGSSNYSPCSYDTAKWIYTSLRNTGDAMQVRYPNGQYFHGIAYGDTPMLGGVDSLLLDSADGTGKTYYFTSGNYRDSANYIIGMAVSDETPGQPNNSDNEAYLSNQNDCILALGILNFKLMLVNDSLKARWEMSEENNHYQFKLNRTRDLQSFQLVPLNSVNRLLPPKYLYHLGPAPIGPYYYQLSAINLYRQSFKTELLYMEYYPNNLYIVGYDLNSNNGEKWLQIYSKYKVSATLLIYNLYGEELLHHSIQLKRGENKVRLGTFQNGSSLIFIKIFTDKECTTSKLLYN
ncbi:MAG: hypothetical protein IIA45_13155 [Bacteroidetes bacterium]|nr:hypothetical protein [Bacteroidota bacterium]